jgi:hypothetical protein
MPVQKIRTIKVPKVPRSAYNPERPASELLKAQIAMLEQANLSFDPGTAVRARAPQTEGQAARYIQQLHAALRGHLRKRTEQQNELSPTELRAALAPRSSSTADGSKRWAATAGPSVRLRESRKAAPGTAARPRSRKRRTR